MKQSKRIEKRKVWKKCLKEMKRLFPMELVYAQLWDGKELDPKKPAIFAAVNEILETKSSDPGPDPIPDPPASNDLGDGGGAGAGGSY